MLTGQAELLAYLQADGEDMIKLFRKIFTIGRVAEAYLPLAPDRLEKAAPFGGSVQLRHVDAGSCNGCEIEIGSAFGPVHDAERYGARLVASPRHADAVLVTGLVTRNMAEPLRRTFEALPEPRVVVAVATAPATVESSPVGTGWWGRSTPWSRSTLKCRAAHHRQRPSSRGYGG